MKKFLALVLCMLLVMSSITVVFAAGTIAPDVQIADYKEANTRTTPVPVGTDGLIQLNGPWNSNVVAYTDEATDGTIQRLSFYTTSGDHDWYSAFLYCAGMGGNFAFRPWNTTTPMNGETYLQWDFGMPIHVDETVMYYKNVDSDCATLDAIPLNAKFEWSNDGESWTPVVMPEYDLTDVETIKSYYDDETAAAMVEAYALWVEGGAEALTEGQKALLHNGVTYEVNTTARYLRYYPLANGQQNYMDRGQTYISIRHLDMYDYSECSPWTGEGSGTRTDPIIISSLDDFKTLANYINNGKTYTNRYISLKADIDLAGINWAPMPSFGGIFNGNNNVIRNLTIGSADAMVANSYTGLFGQNNGTIKNLGMEDVAIYCGAQTNGDPRMGAFAAQNYGIIENCYAENVYLYMAPTGVGGGITGDNRDGAVIRNCYVAGSNYIMNSRPGGLIGDNYGSAIVENCYASGYSYIGSDGSGYNTNNHGGLIGENHSSSVINCYSWVEETDLTNGNHYNATEVTKAQLTDGTLAANLGDAYVQGFDYPVLASFAETDAIIKGAVKGDGTYTVTYAATLAQADASAKVIVALYSGNELVDVRFVSVSEVSTTLDGANADMAKLFIFSSLTSIKPLIVNAEYPIN